MTNNERRIYCYDPLNWKSSLGNSILLTRVFSLKIDQWKECPSGANEVVRQLRDGFQRQGQNIQQQELFHQVHKNCRKSCPQRLFPKVVPKVVPKFVPKVVPIAVPETVRWDTKSNDKNNIKFIHSEKSTTCIDVTE